MDRETEELITAAAKRNPSLRRVLERFDERIAALENPPAPAKKTPARKRTPPKK